MYLVTILLKTSSHLFQFHYDNFKDADKVRLYKDDISRLVESSSDFLTVEDSYGSKASIRIDEIAGIILTDLDREMIAQEAVEWSKYQKDIKLQKKVQESPAARILQPASTLRA
jgi:hypothetical protein